VTRNSKLFRVVGGLVVVLALLTGCSASNPPSTPGVSAQVILRNASDRMQALNSFHFVLDQVGGGTPIAMGIEMKGAEGDVVKPDKMKLNITGSAMGFVLQVQLIVIGDTIEMTNPLNGKWENLSDQFKILSVFDPNSGVAAILNGVANLSELPDEQAGGVNCYHLKGTVTSDSLSALTGSAASGVTVGADLWIGKDDFLPRSFKLAGRITE
jgi:hypothetical protein